MEKAIAILTQELKDEEYMYLSYSQTGMSTTEVKKVIDHLNYTIDILKQHLYIMITEKEYQEAQKIVAAYEEQSRLSYVKHKELMSERQREREIACGEHYYLPRGKWQTGMECQDCGKII